MFVFLFLIQVYESKHQRNRFSIPATSTSSERAFSAMGRIKIRCKVQTDWKLALFEGKQ
jgi:hypothetical protein